MSELNRLRCRLRAVNIEYSALVRRKVGEAAYARMRELRTERRMLMALIAVVRHAAEMDRALEFALSGPVRSALPLTATRCPEQSFSATSTIFQREWSQRKKSGAR